MIAELTPILSHYKLAWFSKPSVSFATFFTPTACPGFTDIHSCMCLGLLSHLLPFFRLSSLKMCICTCAIRPSEKLIYYGPSSSQNMVCLYIYSTIYIVCLNIALCIDMHVFMHVVRVPPLGVSLLFPSPVDFWLLLALQMVYPAPFRSQKFFLLIINTYYLFTANYKIYTIFCL